CWRAGGAAPTPGGCRARPEPLHRVLPTDSPSHRLATPSSPHLIESPPHRVEHLDRFLPREAAQIPKWIRHGGAPGRHPRRASSIATTPGASSAAKRISVTRCARACRLPLRRTARGAVSPTATEQPFIVARRAIPFSIVGEVTEPSSTGTTWLISS